MNTILSDKQIKEAMRCPDTWGDCEKCGTKCILLIKTQARHLLNLLNEPCDEHDITEPFNYNYHYNMWTGVKTQIPRYQKRYYCDKCMAEIEREIKRD